MRADSYLWLVPYGPIPLKVKEKNERMLRFSHFSLLSNSAYTIFFDELQNADVRKRDICCPEDRKIWSPDDLRRFKQTQIMEALEKNIKQRKNAFRHSSLPKSQKVCFNKGRSIESNQSCQVG